MNPNQLKCMRNHKKSIAPQAVAPPPKINESQSKSIKDNDK